MAQYKQVMENIKLNMPELFPYFLKEIYGYMMKTIPINIVVIMSSLIPFPAVYAIIQMLLQHMDEALDYVIKVLLITAIPSSSVSQFMKSITVEQQQGGNKHRKINKYTKKYYLNRINTTIQKFYKTNKTRIRKRKL
jgi:hypothetical protein